MNYQKEINEMIVQANNDESHTERDSNTFHPSQLVRCAYQCTNSKFGLTTHDLSTLKAFRIGTLFHEWLEGQFSDRKRFEPEKRLSSIEHCDGEMVNLVGSCDLYDREENAIVDFKTTKSFHYHNPYTDGPKEDHVNQIQLYMHMFNDVDKGKIVYIKKDDFEIRDTAYVEYDFEKVNSLLKKAVYRKRTYEEFYEENAHYPFEEIDNPFEKCDCWVCSLD